MNWITINNEEDINNISKSDDYAIIYKHSPRCMTSLMTYRQLKSEVSAAQHIDMPIYMVDVIKNRSESQFIANTFLVHHESPQILVMKNGVCIYNTSHERISLEAALNQIKQEA